jgi:hypothetical protein
MALGTHVSLGNHDGASFCTSWSGHEVTKAVFKTVQGLVHNYGGLLSKRPSLMSISLIILTPRSAMRWMLGMMEAGFFPGVAYYLSWYTHILLPFLSDHSHPL